MKYLIDTHTAIWYIEGDNWISTKTKEIIDNYDNKIYYSIVSLWEIGIKLNINKLKLTISFNEFSEFLNKLNFTKIDLINKYFESYIKLRVIQDHRDPFDRMIIAQAITENIPIISADSKFDLYYSEIKRIW